MIAKNSIHGTRLLRIGRIDGTLNSLRNFIQSITPSLVMIMMMIFIIKSGNTKKLKLNLREWNCNDE
jgi:hypothetical protein